jgi:outer membrane receptor protein involved in Fe transport
MVCFAQTPLYADENIFGDGTSSSEYTFPTTPNGAPQDITENVTLYLVPTLTTDNGGVEQGGLIKVPEGEHLIFQADTTLKLDTQANAGGVCTYRTSYTGPLDKNGICAYSRRSGSATTPWSTTLWYKYIMLDAVDATLEFNAGSKLFFDNGKGTTALNLIETSATYRLYNYHTNYFLVNAHIGTLILNTGSTLEASVASFVTDSDYIHNIPGYYRPDPTTGVFAGPYDGGGIMIDNIILRSGSLVSVYEAAQTRNMETNLAMNVVFDITDNTNPITVTGPLNLSGYDSTVFQILDNVNYLSDTYKDEAFVKYTNTGTARNATWNAFDAIVQSLKTTLDSGIEIFNVVDASGEKSQWDLDFEVGDYFTLLECVDCTDRYYLSTQGQLHIKDSTEKNDFEDISYALTTFPEAYMDESGDLIPMYDYPQTNKLRFMYLGAHYVSEAREMIYLESWLANATFLTQASSLLADAIPAHARQWKKPEGWSVLMSSNYFNQSLKSGSHIDYKGFSILLGPAWHRATQFGNLTIGGFVEAGDGKYETENRYPDRKVNGSGDVSYIGGGVFASHEFDSGYHAEASLRGGWLKNGYDATNQSTGRRDRLREAKFNTESAYYGAHGGVGYAFEYKPDLLMDVFGQLLWTHILEADAKTAVTGTPINFGHLNLVNLRAGVRFVYTGFERLKLYASGTFDSAFEGNYANGRAFGEVISKIDHPSTEGSTGIFEAGINWKPYRDYGFSIDLSGKVLTGQTTGGSGSLMMKWEFDADNQLAQNSSPAKPGLLASLTGRNASPSAGDGQPAGYGTTDKPRGTFASPASGDDPDQTNEGTLETVTVEPTRPDWERILSPGTVSVVTPDDFRGEQKTVADMLEKVPGLFIHHVSGTGQYTTVSVRGSTAPQVAIYIDGVPQKKGGDAAVDLSMIPVNNIARIEVYRGYIPVRFDGAPIGGAINVVTKRPEDANTRVAFGVRSFQGYTGEMTFASPLWRGSLLVGATHDRSKGDFKYRHPGDGVTGELAYDYPRYRRRMSNSYEKTDIMVKWQDDNWFVKFAWKDGEQFLPMQILPMDNGQVDVPRDKIKPYAASNPSEVRRQRILQRDFSIGRRQTWGDLDWGFRLDHTTQNKRYRYIDGPDLKAKTLPYGRKWSDYDTTRWGGALDVSYKLGDRNLIEFHGDYSYETLHVDVSDKTNTGGVPYNSIVLDKYSQKIWHLQLQDTITLNEAKNFWLTVIGRLDRMIGDTARGKKEDGNLGWVSTWAVALKKDFGEHWTGRASYGTYNRFPNFYEMFGDGAYLYPSVLETAGADKVTREHGYQWDAGIDWRDEFFGVRAKATVNYFNRLVHDSIMLVARQHLSKYVNNQSVKFQGVEFEAQLTKGPLSLYMAATWQTFEDAGQNKDRAYPFYIQLPKRMYNARLSYDLFDGRVNVFAEDVYTGKVSYLSDINDPHPKYMAPLNIINVGLKWSVTDSFKLTVGANDINNEGPRQKVIASDYSRSSGTSIYRHALVPYPQQGRTLYTTVEYSF